MNRCRSVLGCFLAVILVIATLYATEPRTPVTVTTSELGGADRYMTYVSTDKPIYRPGETMYVRGVVLHHKSRKPLPTNINLQAAFNIKGPKGDSVASGWVNSQESVFGLQWKVPDEQVGGEYTVNVTYPGYGYTPAERKFDVRVYRAPRLKSQIKFLRDGYGAGDEVAAMLSVERAEGGIPQGATVAVMARVDGKEVFQGPAVVDSSGKCVARFELPRKIERGEGTLAMVIHDGGVVETASKTIPILLQTVDVELYPEGGDLIAGLPNRVYFEAFTPANKPADLAGIVIDQEGKEVARFESQHEGRGRFQLTPRVGEKYSLKLTQPSGIDTVFPLPEVKQGAVLQSVKNVYRLGEPVVLKAGTSEAKRFSVTLRQRETEIANLKFVDVSNGLAEAKFTPPDSASGVLVATVWDVNGKPLAERLIFRQPIDTVQIKITPNAKRYTPGGLAKFDIVTTDAAGEPISAVVGLTVTDDSVLEMVETRDQAPRLPVMVLLEDEVKDLADAQIYFDPNSEDSDLAVDLLLGTQGWRRFSHVKFEDFLADHGDDARRAFAMRLENRFGISAGFAKASDEMIFGMVEEVAVPANAMKPAAIRREALQLEEEDASEGDLDLAGNGVRDIPVAGNRPLQRRVRAPEDQNLRSALEGRLSMAAEDSVAGDRFFLDEVANDFVAVRVYAHQPRADRKIGDRVDFTETLYWNAGVKTDQDGKTTVEFALNDSVTSFRASVDAFAENGALGQSSVIIESIQPFYLEPKLPLEVSTGDQVRIPVGLVNATDRSLMGGDFTLESAMAGLGKNTSAAFSLNAQERLRRLFRIGPFKQPGKAELVLNADIAGYSDRVTRSIVVKPLGFPVESGFGGLIEGGETVTHEIAIPPSLIGGSLTTRVVIYPTPLASMNEALERLIREPYGCFEQTSSSTYPLVMAQQYFMSHQGVDPSLIQRSADMLEKGYQRLIGYECKGGGFEWFGNDPGHDALTAYGLMEFTDMAEVRHVDPAMLQRTREWLLNQRDGKGGFERKTNTLHTWLADPDVAFTYNTWALLKASVDADLLTEVAWIRNTAEATDNTYVTALAANVFSLAGDSDGEEHMLDKLAGLQASDGSLEGSTVWVVGSGGEALKIETTALAATAWLRNPAYSLNVERAIEYLSGVCKGGRFGSTQSTILALQAIVAYDQARAKPKAPGTLQLVVDGRPIGEPVAFTKDTQGAIELPSFSELLTEGKHKIQVVMTGDSEMPYSITADYHTLTPNSSDECKLHLEVALANRKVEEGASTEVNVSLFNTTSQKIPTPTAIIGIPGGLEVRHDQLKELVAAGKIAAYEVRGREVILYWLALEAEQRVDVSISLIAAIPGTYTGPASRGYLYYTDEHKIWCDGLAAKISPAK
ncbi:MG2 domain-containing protein [Rubripirellula sp.]|nr:MG2 domain-containing protein [Rubripirellula sp.]MDB4624670.1 MG2 domain-containing protein [Rubripirellula sp.]